MPAVLRLEHIGDDIVAYQRYGRFVNHLYEHRLRRGQGRRQLRPWVARLNAIHPRFGFAREFLHGVRDYTEATNLGRRGIYEYFVLRPGLYEINERISLTRNRHYFIRVFDDGEIQEVERGKVQTLLTGEIKHVCGD